MALVDAIKKLHTSMIDTRPAYEKARDDAEDPALKALFGEMADLRSKDHGALHHVLTEMGEQPNEDGSFMTNVHKAVVAVRSAVKGIDRDALASFASGEETILKEYDDALAQDGIRPETTALLTRQRAALVDKIADMNRLGGN